MTGFRAQRIRDPLHNLIEFDADQFEHTMWRVIQTQPFQRLRRVRQLGFSEFVFPGATHTRFAHSIGVFHTARQLMRIIHRHIDRDSCRQYRQHQAEVALAAALVHDVGHGMFSHAFEEIGKELQLPLARHETVSEMLIRDSEVAEVLRELGSGFANDVADVIKGGKPGNLYDAVVSSQFDADRLDYMQRDRLMTGVQSSGIDATWLLANLEIASVQIGADADKVGTVETLVLGRKAFHVAESYVLSLFQLYPNVYFHKATRAAEKVFSRLMLSLVPLVRDGDSARTGLPSNHPIVRFIREPTILANATALDDAVFWGAVPLLIESDDQLVAECARRLWERKLPKSVDVRQLLEQEEPPVHHADTEARQQRAARIALRCRAIVQAFEAKVNERPASSPPVFIDQVRRPPYKRFQDSQSLLNQILIQSGDGVPRDMAEISPVVAGAETFEVCRVYITERDTESRSMLMNIMRTSVGEITHASP
ncbi:MAG: HD domain-containing protein [Alphaproteobacteria bacterium]|nr:HD domain-containing protein [Alphaproteobacteria bacterium]